MVQILTLDELMGIILDNSESHKLLEDDFWIEGYAKDMAEAILKRLKVNQLQPFVPRVWDIPGDWS